MAVWAQALAQTALVLVLAPLVQGMLQRIKAVAQHRHGPGLLQPYFTLAKLWRRQDLRPRGSSWVFAATPCFVLAVLLAASAALPLLWTPAPPGWSGDFVFFVGLLALERFALSLAGLDTGTPFGGLGSSRDAVVAALVEPALFALALPWMAAAGGTGWPALMAASASAPAAGVVRFFGLAAALIVALAETGRVPVDNPDTHLELTMIHEAMLLEYSGPQLALVSLAQMLKQLLVLAAVADLLLPWGAGWTVLPAVLRPLTVLGTWFGLGAGLAVAESLSAKLRFFRLPAYVGAATALSLAAAVLEVWGGR